MADAILTVLTALPGITKLAGEIVALSDKAKSNAQLIEFQQALIGLNSAIASVQQENATLLRQKSDAEEALERMKDWKTQSKRYKLAAPFAGCMVMALQKDMSGGETDHYLCAGCFNKAKPVFLQGREGRPLGKDKGYVRAAYVCPECGSEAFTGYSNVVAPKYFEDITPET
jgi:hypothetical protein